VKNYAAKEHAESQILHEWPIVHNVQGKSPRHDGRVRAGKCMRQLVNFRTDLDDVWCVLYATEGDRTFTRILFHLPQWAAVTLQT
jgi:hypothetical protein